MSEQTLESLCAINPETLDAATPIDFEFRYLDISAVTKGRIDWSSTRLTRFADAPSRARRRVRSGDVLLCTVRPGLQSHTRIRGEESQSIVGSTGFAVLRPHSRADSGFIFHQLFSNGVASQLRALETGSSYPAVNESDVRRLRLNAPGPRERQRIAAVLDTVDEAIAKTEAVIAKLKQVHAGLLHDLLTRGLDEHGQLRDPITHPEQFQDSPLGRIPRAWEIRTLNEIVASAVDGPFGSNLKTEHYVNEPGVRVVRLQNIDSGRFDESDKAFVSEDHAISLQRHQVVSGDLLVASMGDENHPLARACLYPAQLAPGIVKADCFRLRMKTTMAMNGFVMLFLNCPSTRRELNILGQGVTRDRVNLTTLLTLLVLRPPVEEQKHIVKIIDALDMRIQTEEALRFKLAFLKSGLMSDLLTGRVRVPESVSTVENQP